MPATAPSLPPLPTPAARTRAFLLFYLLLVLAMLALAPLVMRSRWSGSGDIHSCLDIFSGLLALTAGASALAYFFGLRDRYHLLVGFAFFVVGGENLVHGIMSFPGIWPKSSADLARFVPATYVTSRILLALLIMAAVIASELPDRVRSAACEAVTCSAAAVACGIGGTAVAFYLPLPRFIFPEQLVARPVDLVSALLFGLAFCLVLWRARRKQDIFSALLAACLLINACGQTYMSFSKRLFDACFDLAHVAHALGGVMPLLGIALQGLATTRQAQALAEQRRLAENRARGTAREWHDTFAAVGDPILIADNEFRILRMNRAAMERFGGDRRGQPCPRVVHGSDHPPPECLLCAIQRGAAERTLELRLPVDPKRRYLVSVYPVMDATGKPKRLVHVFQDVTRLRRDQQRLERLSTDLRRSNQELRQFAYVASHDLQEPLRVIGSYAKLLGKEAGQQLNGRARQWLDYLTDAAGRMQTLINDLLAMSRLETNAEPRRRVDCADLLAQTQVDLAVNMERSRARVECGPLPVVEGFPTQLRQLFQNLLGNAIKYRRDGVEPLIRVDAVEEDGYWHFRVADNGIGIDPKHHAEIFEAFRRLHPRGKYDGTGIGLAICSKVVARHNGRIWVESAPGRGATFHFTLPMERSNSDPAA